MFVFLKICLNSELFFPWSSYHAKVKELVYPTNEL